MQLIIKRNKESHQGFSVDVVTDSKRQTYCLINGNLATYQGITVLLSIDQHVVYGMSHPSVISRILSRGPQVMLSTKELAHKLFEHGMKASVGKLKIGDNPVQTTLETFYTLMPEFPTMRMRVLANWSSPVLEIALKHPSDQPPLFISTRKIPDMLTSPVDAPRVELESVNDQITVDL